MHRYICTYIHVHLYYVCIHAYADIYIYIYIYRCMYVYYLFIDVCISLVCNRFSTHNKTVQVVMQEVDNLWVINV